MSALEGGKEFGITLEPGFNAGWVAEGALQSPIELLRMYFEAKIVSMGRTSRLRARGRLVGMSNARQTASFNVVKIRRFLVGMETLSSVGALSLYTRFLMCSILCPIL